MELFGEFVIFNGCFVAKKHLVQLVGSVRLPAVDARDLQEILSHHGCGEAEESLGYNIF